MNLEELGNATSIRSGWIHFHKGSFELNGIMPKNRRENRETLARLYIACCSYAEKCGKSSSEANRFVRLLWNEENPAFRSKSLPSIILDDGFLGRYALGKPMEGKTFSKIWKKIDRSLQTLVFPLNPIQLDWNLDHEKFYDIDATPPGIMSKLFTAWRLQKDEGLLRKIQEDLEEISFIEEPEKRKWLTLAILSHAAAYRELDGRAMYIPSFKEKGMLVTYSCFHHLIAEGIKTISMLPFTTDAPGIYLCQGTELWPSQPSALGSILANFGYHGSATEAYAHSWRRIHKHLRDLRQESRPLPIACGHSMGGALSIQIGLYSHDLVEKIYAFNPPMPHERDYLFYHEMAPSLQTRIHVIANLDDFAFWRIGERVIGNVTIFLGKRRWRYHQVGFFDIVFFIPAFVKFFLNVHHAFPAHQRIIALSESYVSVKLTQQEIEKENQDRVKRFDYLSFFPKLYDPMKIFVRFIRWIFGWRLKDRYLQGEIEIIALHERDLIDTLNEENKREIEKQLRELKRQKERLIRQLKDSQV